MAKITLADGMVIEGTIEEFKQMGVKFPIEETAEKGEGEYRKVTDRKPKAGDFIKYDEAPYSYLTSGKYYEINRIDSYDDPRITDDDGDDYGTSGDDFEVYEKVSGAIPTETITHNGATYMLVDRKAQPGDVVILTETEGNLFKTDLPYEVKNGLQIADDDGDLFNLYRPRLNRTPANVKVYAPVKALEQKAEPLKVGDYAKVTNKVREFEEGNIVKIVGDKSNGDVKVFDFKVEFVNVTGKSKFANQTYGYIDAMNIVKATDEEVAQAEKAAIEAKWARIGRKPNEFKKGDIVKYKSDGEICEVVEINEEGRPRVKTKSHGVCTEYTDAKSDIELITPVEARFDGVGIDR